MPRLEFHDTQKHARWLNMVEVETGVMVSEWLDRRIPKGPLLVEVKAWLHHRNREKARIRSQFTVDEDRKELGWAYPPGP